MNPESLRSLVKVGILRKRDTDFPRIRSILQSVQTDAKIAKTIPLNEDSATMVFRELYESVRQLGDARWWLSGFEPTNHDISLEILKELKIKNAVLLNHLERFKKIRHDANYRGFRVSMAQAKEMIEFWDKCGEEIIKELMNEIR